VTNFIRSGNTYTVYPSDSLDVRTSLPAGNYVLKKDMMKGFFLEDSSDFTSPSKVYGDCLKNVERILNTFNSRSSNTGVLLSGEKGSGKTLLARQIAITSNLPVIIINTSYCGDHFNSFLSSITQPCVIFLDEFEKVYSREEQEQVLTLFDGTFQSKKLFLLTCNDKWRIDGHMRNRPGRIFYFMEFGGLEEKFIREYCEDRLADKSYTDKIVDFSRLFTTFNFDVLVALVEECNRYGGDLEAMVEIMNAKPEYSGKSNYTVSSVTFGGIAAPSASVKRNKITFIPSQQEFNARVRFVCPDEDGESLAILASLEEGSHNGGLEGADYDGLISLLESEKVKFGNQHSYGYNPFGEGVEITTYDVQISCQPESLIFYSADGGPCYNPSEGVYVHTKKTGAASRRKDYEMYND
jgi:hypothetical protein